VSKKVKTRKHPCGTDLVDDKGATNEVHPHSTLPKTLMYFENFFRLVFLVKKTETSVVGTCVKMSSSGIDARRPTFKETEIKNEDFKVSYGHARF